MRSTEPAHPQRRARLIQALAGLLTTMAGRLAIAQSSQPPASDPAPKKNASSPANTPASPAASAGNPAATTPATNAAPPQVVSNRPLPSSLEWKEGDSLIVHNDYAIETRREVLGRQVITPTRSLFVRDNAAPPPARILEERGQWAVSFSGVAEPDAYTLAELQAMPSRTVATVLQCPENGRGLQAVPAPGTPWQTGGAGCVIWTGVPLTTVVHELGGIAPESRYLTATGGDVLPDGIPSDFTRVERSVPVSAMEHALLAWKLNGEPIPLAHGGPLRLVLPGYASINYIKYVKRIAFTKDESSAHIQTADFRVPLRPGQPNLTIPAWRLPVKSWITSPTAADTTTVKAGPVQIEGVAMGGSSAVTRIEVSADGGRNWEVAHLTGPDFGPFAWRLFTALLTLPAGPAVLVCRASNAAGQQQPERTRDNTGYFVNGWHEHRVVLTVNA